jgi:DNA-binding NtrC family response regulator
MPPSGAHAPTPDDFARLNLVGASPAFLALLKLVGRMIHCDATVLVVGETGTGKELVARAIHYLGHRRASPFIAINCGAIPDTLVENELFGHARGAFTDAREARTGVIAQAQGGTLFLDEIEAMSPRAQVTLLRFLQDREYKPVGGARTCSADVRVIAASNADLDAMAGNGRFRPDLLYRLNVLALRVPPLRQRPGDAVLLAEAFMQRLSRQYRTQIKTLHEDTVAFLDAYAWPGNVRELENFIHREFLLTDGPVIRAVSAETSSDIWISSDTGGATDRARPDKMLTATAFRQAKARAIAEFERAYIAELLSRAAGNISLAARLAGKERSRLGKLVKKYGLGRQVSS